MQNNNVKSSVVAGLLGIFLGGFGAHDWYLGDKKKGAIHVCLFAAGFVIAIIVGILTASMSWYTIYKMEWLFALLGFLYTALICGNSIWGFVEGIIILVKGDAGLAAKGYKVATTTGAQPTQNSGSADSSDNKSEN